MTEKAEKLVQAYVDACYDYNRAGTNDYLECEQAMNRAKSELNAYITRVESLAVTAMKNCAYLREEAPDFRPEDAETPG